MKTVVYMFMRSSFEFLNDCQFFSIHCNRQIPVHRGSVSHCTTENVTFVLCTILVQSLWHRPKIDWNTFAYSPKESLYMFLKVHRSCLDHCDAFIRRRKNYFGLFSLYKKIKLSHKITKIFALVGIFALHEITKISLCGGNFENPPQTSTT